MVQGGCDVASDSVPRNAHRVTIDPLPRSRIWVSLLTGVLTGCSGLTGFRGFGVYLLGHLLLSILLLVKTKNAPSKYFASRYVVSGRLSNCSVVVCVLDVWIHVQTSPAAVEQHPPSTPQTPPPPFYAHSLTLLTSNVFAQTELLTFVLFWTLTNNIVFLF